MLNIARLDTQHTSEAKKAALEELDYATVSMPAFIQTTFKLYMCYVFV